MVKTKEKILFESSLLYILLKGIKLFAHKKQLFILVLSLLHYYTMGERMAGYYAIKFSCILKENVICELIVKTIILRLKNLRFFFLLGFILFAFAVLPPLDVCKYVFG